MISDRGPAKFADDKWEAIAQQYKFKSEKEMLSTLYESMSIMNMSVMFKVGTTTIQRRLAVNGIKLRKRGGPQARTNQRYKMFHVDQRIVISMGLTFCARFLDVSNASLYKYKQWKQGRTGGKAK